MLTALAQRPDHFLNELPIENPVAVLTLIFGNGETLGKADSMPLNDPFVGRGGQRFGILHGWRIRRSGATRLRRLSVPQTR